MRIEILTPEAKLFEGDAESVILPGAKGQFQVLKGHAPVISNLEKGEVVVRTSEGEKRFEVTGGVAEVLNDKVNILV